MQHDGKTIGSVLVTRVRGEHGGIEIVVGIEPAGAVKGVLLQSQREPDNVRSEIAGARFLNSFAGKTAVAPFRVGGDLPAAPDAARVSAQAIADGVRSQLIVLSFAEASPETRESGIHTNH